MNTDEIIDAILKIEHGEQPSFDMTSILMKHRCTYLLSKIRLDQGNRRFTIEKTMNSISVKERLHACQALFSQKTIPYAVVKGAVLSQSAYGNPLLRSSSDIDILIDRDDSEYLDKMFQKNGFVQGRIINNEIIPFNREELLFHSLLTHQKAPYIKKTGNPFCPFVNIDINLSIYWEPHSHILKTKDVLRYTEETNLYGFPFRKLSTEMEFVALCLHHFKDMNSIYLILQGSFRFSLFCDIYHFLKNAKPNKKVLVDLCQRTRSGKYLYVCLYYTSQIYKEDIVFKYLSELESFKDSSLIDTFGLEENNKKQWDINIYDRIFGEDTKKAIESKLSFEELKKIELNKKYM